MLQTERGRLKIFFSYAEGIGKTQAMLREAQALKILSRLPTWEELM